MSQPLVELHNLSCVKEGQALFEDVNLTINEGPLCSLPRVQVSNEMCNRRHHCATWQKWFWKNDPFKVHRSFDPLRWFNPLSWKVRAKKSLHDFNFSITDHHS
jgi:hypothetical protein